jgi:uncharacterized protein YhjY with autotransporter beta-barrel domain
MRAIMVGTTENAEVIGEAFGIDGSVDKFIVHRSLANDPDYPLWVASHLASTLSFGYGDTPDEAIAHGRKRWAERTPEQITAALDKAYAWSAKRLAKRAGKAAP